MPAVPIYQTTFYVFRDSTHAAARFGLADAGNIYGRMTIRLSIGTEHIDDIITDLEKGFAAAAQK